MLSLQLLIQTAAWAHHWQIWANIPLPCYATDGTLLPSQQPQLWNRSLEEPGVIFLRAAYFTRCNGWCLQGSLIWCLFMVLFYLPKAISLKHQGKLGVISIVKNLGLDSQLLAPAECSCCNPECPQEHQTPDFQHWNLSLKLQTVTQSS